MFDHYGHVQKLAAEGATWEALLHASINSAWAFSDLQNIAERANLDTPYFLESARIKLPEDSFLVGDAVDDLLRHTRQLSGLITEKMATELALANRETATIAGQPGHSCVDALLRVINQCLRVIAIAVDRTRNHEPWPFTIDEISDSALWVVRAVSSFTKVDLERVEIDFAKEYQRVTGRFPANELGNMRGKADEENAEDAIVTAIAELTREGKKFPSQKLIARKAGYSLQTIKNTTPGLVASGTIGKGPSGTGFQVL